MNDLTPSPIPAAAASQVATAGNIATIEAVMPRHVAAVVPFADHAAFGRLTPDQKARVSYLLQLFAEMVSSPEGLVACSERLSALNPARGMSAVNLRTLYYKFKRNGWRALAKIYKGPDQLPAEFVEHYRRLTDNNSRSARAEMVKLRDRWAAGESIPGYGTWREYHATRFPERDVPERYPMGFLPPGWKESNLYKKRSITAQRKMKTHGYAAAHRYLPGIVRDTSKLRPLELITIDDFELDFLVQAFNPVSKRWEICRATGLLAIDVATRRKLAVGIKPRFKLTRSEQTTGEASESDENRRQIGITRADVQELLHSVFSTHGRPADYGCTILCENASAAITADFEIALELLLGVQVARTGLIHEKTLANGFVQGGGKPWQKGWIESLFSLVWNYSDTLPGQKGSSYQLKPADHAAKLLYAQNLLKLDGLPAAVAAELRVPFFKIDQALAALEEIFNVIERRTDHRCNGFERVFQYQLPDRAGLVDEATLALLTQEDVLAAVPVPRMESPVERWERLYPQCRFEKFASYVLACLLLTPKKVTLRNLRLSFSDGEGKGYTFADADSPVMRLPEGTELLGYYDAQRANVLHVTDLKGAYLGSVRRRGAIDILDAAAMGAECGEISRLIRACVVNPLRERHAAENEQIAADHAHNQALLQAHGLATLPSATDTAPKTQPTGDRVHATEAARSTGRSPTGGLSAKLAQPRARDAFAAAQAHALPRAIAAQVGAQQAGKTRAEALQGADDLDPGQLL